MTRRGWLIPAYVSVQSALYLHGMISQIPHVIYVASLARTQRVATTIGTYSIHQIAPEFFGGYRTDRIPFAYRQTMVSARLALAMQPAVSS